jgi:uncharacterized membrane protein
MPEQSEDEGYIALTKGRLESLSDGIFAFAMTLLVVGLGLPDKARIIQTSEFAIDLIVSLQSDFFHYVLAFLVLGAFWIGHHLMLHPVRRVDKAYVWLNLVTLMFVALLPFSTSFSGDFPGVPTGSIVFEANLFAIGMGLFSQVLYSTNNHRLVAPSMTRESIQSLLSHNLLVPGVSLAGILIALGGNTSSTMVYLALPVIDIILHKKFG